MCSNNVQVTLQGSTWVRYDWCLQSVVVELLRCPVATGIQELTVTQYKDDFIGGALKEMEISRVLRSDPGHSHTHDNFKILRATFRGLDIDSNPECTLRNLERIRLVWDSDADAVALFSLDAIPDAHEDSRDNKRNILGLDAMEREFPNLVQFEFSTCLLDYPSSCAAAREIESNYPKWTVNLISNDREFLLVPPK